MNPDLQARAEALLALAEKMTPGPWERFQYIGHGALTRIRERSVAGCRESLNIAECVTSGRIDDVAASYNAGGICKLRNDAPGLIRELLAELDEAWRQRDAEQEKYLALLVEIMPTWIMAENFAPDMAIQEARRLLAENAEFRRDRTKCLAAYLRVVESVFPDFAAGTRDPGTTEPEDVVREIERLKAENAALKARIAKLRGQA